MEAQFEPLRHHTHPISPLLQGLRSVPTLVAVAIFFGINLARDIVSTLRSDPDSVPLADLITTVIPVDSPRASVFVLVAMAFLVLLGITGLAWLRWNATTYWFDADGDLRVDSGVLSRNQRRLQLSRLQTVDVIAPLIARPFGMSELRMEVAGQGESRASLQFLDAHVARALRAEILSRAAGVGVDAGEAPEVPLIRVPTGSLIVSLLLTTRVWVAFAIAAIFTTSTFATAGAAGFVTAVLSGSVPLLVAFQEFNRFYGFTVAESPDGLRLRHGLLQTYAQTVPPGRVQAIGIVEPFLWRSRNWVRLRVNLAGVGSADGQSGGGETVLIPVAPRHVAQQLLDRALPGVDVESTMLEKVPARVRWRAPLQQASLGVGWTDDFFATRVGWLTRVTSVIPHARTQSVRVTQGPWQRALGVASMHVDSTPGPVQISALHRPTMQARMLAHEQVARARSARSVDRPPRWAS
jgi:putative membrane protein